MRMPRHTLKQSEDNRKNSRKHKKETGRGLAASLRFLFVYIGDKSAYNEERAAPCLKGRPSGRHRRGLRKSFLRIWIRCRRERNGTVNKDQIYEQLCAVCTHVERDAALSEYTTFKVGGPADLLIKPGDLLQLMAVMFIVRREQIPYVVLGNGSNVLVKDGGFRGAVILLEAFGACEADPDTGIVSAGAGALLGEVAKAAARASLTGLEFAAGIPGSLGGGVFMNAGAYGGEMSQVITEVVALMPDGLVHTFPAQELDFGYRHSVFCENGGIVLRAEMQLAKGDPEKITETMKDLNRRRVEKQPLNYPSAGSTFKRPEGYFAGKLIQDAGCRGLSVGGALVSPKHAGFIVNKGNATAQDILDRIHLVQLRVKDTFGVDLETEVRIIGE